MYIVDREKTALNVVDYAAEEAKNELWVSTSLERGGGRLEVREKMNGPPLPRRWSLRLRQSSEDLRSIPDEGSRGGGALSDVRVVVSLRWFMGL